MAETPVNETLNLLNEAVEIATDHIMVNWEEGQETLLGFSHGIQDNIDTEFAEELDSRVLKENYLKGYNLGAEVFQAIVEFQKRKS